MLSERVFLLPLCTRTCVPRGCRSSVGRRVSSPRMGTQVSLNPGRNGSAAQRRVHGSAGGLSLAIRSLKPAFPALQSRLVVPVQWFAAPALLSAKIVGSQLQTAAVIVGAERVANWFDCRPDKSEGGAGYAAGFRLFKRIRGLRHPCAPWSPFRIRGPHRLTACCRDWATAVGAILCQW